MFLPFLSYVYLDKCPLFIHLENIRSTAIIIDTIAIIIGRYITGVEVGINKTKCSMITRSQIVKQTWPIAMLIREGEKAPAFAE